MSSLCVVPAKIAAVTSAVSPGAGIPSALHRDDDRDDPVSVRRDQIGELLGQYALFLRLAARSIVTQSRTRVRRCAVYCSIRIDIHLSTHDYGCL